MPDILLRSHLLHNRQRTARRTVNNTGLRAVSFSPQETLYAIHNP